MAKADRRFVISLGGSVVAPKEGPDPDFLKSLAAFFRRQAGRGRRFVLVIGGGGICRSYQEAARAAGKPTDSSLDWIGIRATRLNAALIRTVLGSLAHDRIVTDPRIRLSSRAPVIVAAGWKPGFSSDMDAVLLAEGFGSETVINLSNVGHVYDSDPRRNSQAKKIERMSWPEFFRSFGARWTPGMSAPFDPVAARRARRGRKRVIVADGRDLHNLGSILGGRKFRGTVIG